ncbi:MAG: putative lipid II flippase FtsW [candidate division Zixibacteria bacterium]|nr:putative lipid II flippase FtsW [candidate division Zixibacteria bacterium]MDH3939310.1 putative lipid II flippase FtsW [candidate division Zixibacteria bacterium]MDH4033632.1 putative lipid II flippase FtsW [candidate division Zixibacteria bacterium]
MKRSATKGAIDERLLAAYLAALVIGLVMIYSTSSILAEGRFGSHLLFLRQQCLWTLLSLVAVFVISKLNLQRLAIYSAPAVALSMALLVLAFFGPARNEAHRWIVLGPFSGQPSEVFRFVLIFYLAFSLANPRRDLTDLRQLLMPYLPLVGVGLALILLEPDLGSTIVISITVIGIFFLAGARLKHLAAAVLPLAAVGAAVVFGLGYKKDRITDFLAAVADPLLGSYQAKQAALTLGAGGWLGVGLGEGRQKLFFLPYPHTDFIFAASGEEVGLVGLMLILCVLFYLLWRGLKISYEQPDKFGYLLAAGMTLSLFVNIAVNIGVVTSLLPVTGLPLPFISYGGSSLLMSSAAVGVLLNLSRRTVRS